MKARIVEFQNLVWEHYHATGRHDLPWRPPALKVRANGTIDPYRVLVSEVMLQQTQAGRVIQKYVEFLKRFPTLPALAAASPRDVLAAWQGLGYNRRALALHRAAREIIARHKRRVPRVYEDLVALPGIGAYTAGAVLAFAFQEPVVFIETNIRRAHLDFFFSDKENVRDRDILPLVAQTMDAKNPREWYYALMDYGSHLPKILQKNSNVQSKHYIKQSAFKGSLRELRGKIIAELSRKPRTLQSLRRVCANDSRTQEALDALLKDRLIKHLGRPGSSRYSLA